MTPDRALAPAAAVAARRPIAAQGARRSRRAHAARARRLPARARRCWSAPTSRRSRARHIAAAFRLLGRHDLVFGPAEDGGFWLVGARRRPRLPPLFGQVRWSSPHALADTLADLPRTCLGRLCRRASKMSTTATPTAASSPRRGF